MQGEEEQQRPCLAHCCALGCSWPSDLAALSLGPDPSPRSSPSSAPAAARDVRPGEQRGSARRGTWLPALCILSPLILSLLPSRWEKSRERPPAAAGTFWVSAWAAGPRAPSCLRWVTQELRGAARARHVGDAGEEILQPSPAPEQPRRGGAFCPFCPCGVRAVPGARSQNLCLAPNNVWAAREELRLPRDVLGTLLDAEESPEHLLLLPHGWWTWGGGPAVLWGL